MYVTGVLLAALMFGKVDGIGNGERASRRARREGSSKLQSAAPGTSSKVSSLQIRRRARRKPIFHQATFDVLGGVQVMEYVTTT